MRIHAATSHDTARKGSIEARLIFLVCIVPSLLHVAARRLVRGRTSNQSVISEAKTAAHTCVSAAFMG